MKRRLQKELVCDTEVVTLFVLANVEKVAAGATLPQQPGQPGGLQDGTGADDATMPDDMTQPGDDMDMDDDPFGDDPDGQFGDQPDDGMGMDPALLPDDGGVLEPGDPA